jgi:hypothetical protein
LTYNLYFDGDGGPVSENDAASEHLIPPQLPNQDGFCEAFNALLEDPEFMADGGTLAFGLRHVYPIGGSLEHVYNVLKGSDAVVYQSMRALGFDPVLYVYYEHPYLEHLSPQGAMVDKVMEFLTDYEVGTATDVVQEQGGIPVRQDGGTTLYGGGPDFDYPEPMEWVTPLTTYNRQEGAFATHGNRPALNWAYGDVCMIVRIGKAGNRLAFPTVAQVKRTYKRRWLELGHEVTSDFTIGYL